MRLTVSLCHGGINPCGDEPCSVPGGTYGIRAKAVGKGYKPGVVTPHASVLTLEYVPEEAVANLRK